MSIFSMGAGGAEGAYTIDQSMYYGDTPTYGIHLRRQFDQTGSSTMKWTYATWWKKGPQHTNSKTVYYYRPLAISTGADVQLEIANDLNHNEPGFIWQSWAAGGGQSTWYWATKNELILKDYSAWYHICHVIDHSTSPYVFLYINGVLMDPTVIYTHNKTGAGYGAGWGPQSGDTFQVGSNYSTQVAGAYLADTYWIEQQALNPVGTFGEFSEDTGQFVPIEYEGTYTGNSFYLDYADADDFGTDRSGLDNDFTATSIPARRQMPDSPTNNFCLWNPNSKNSAQEIEQGNLQRESGSTWTATSSTIAIPSSGKWYAEFTSGNQQLAYPGLQSEAAVRNSQTSAQNVDFAIIQTGEYRYNGSNEATTGNISTGDIYGISVNADTGVVKVYINNTLDHTYSATLVSGTDYFFTAIGSANFYCNFGQDSSFAGTETAQNNSDANGIGDFYYSPPSGHLALCTSNLPTPEIENPTDYFNTVLYTGTGAADNVITGVGFQSDFTWIKSRSTTHKHMAFDAVRGVDKYIVPNSYSVQSSDSGSLNAWSSDGFTTGAAANTNTNNATFVAWNWKESTTASFDIVSYTGTGIIRTVSHNLGVVPTMIIIKDLSVAENWKIYAEPIGPTKILGLNTTNEANVCDEWNDTSPTSSVFTLGTDAPVNASGNSYIAYLFANIEGYSKVGIYEGNASQDGTFVWCGFKPAFVVTKCIDSTGQWFVFDNKRPGRNPPNFMLEVNATNAENTTADHIDLLSTGFKCRITTNPNLAQTYIYFAFAETPFKTATAR